VNLSNLLEDASMANTSETVDKLGFGLAQVYTLILAYGIWFADGVEVTLAATLTVPIKKQLSLTDMQTASLSSIVFVGIGIGNVLSGYVGEALGQGRRITIILGYFGMFAMTLVCAAATSFVTLAAFRFMLGITMSIGMPASLALVNEMSPPRWQMVMMGMRGVIFVAGNAVASLLIVLDDPSLGQLNWQRVLVEASFVPGLLMLLSTCFLQESPVWLSKTGEHARAQRVLHWVARQNGHHYDHQAEETEGTSIADREASKTVANHFLIYSALFSAGPCCILLVLLLSMCSLQTWWSMALHMQSQGSLDV